MKILRLTEELEDDILKEVNYSREQLKLDLEALKEWLKEQKHLPNTRLHEPDEFLIQFLVGAKGSFEKVKKKLDSYYTLRGLSPIFQDRTDIELQKQGAKLQFALTFPELLPDGCPVLMWGCRDPDMKMFDPVNAARQSFLAAEYLLRSAGITRSMYVMLDAKSFTASHALRTSPTILRTSSTFVQEALSSRLKKYIIFNAPTFVESLINNFVKPFLSDKLRQRLIITSESIEKVFEYPDNLPVDYGGKYPSVAELSEQLHQNLMNWKYLPNLDETVDESLRPRKEGECNPHFGLHGSIKTLVID